MTLATVDRYDSDRVSELGDRAIVVGGSMAGLTAARVLADTFTEVIVLERDALPDKAVARAGAPQTSHPHALLEAGRATLEDLFPGFGEGVLAEGGLLIDSGRDMEYYDSGGFIADTRARLPTYCASRPLFEQVVRRQVRQLETVELGGGRQFIDYLVTEDSTRVTGVRYREGDTERTLTADLVVDATGRTSKTPTWLDANGYESPPTDEITVDVTYGTILVERPPDDRRVFFVPPSAPRPRGAAFIPIEGDRWQVIVQGVHGETPPSDPDDFIEFVESLPVKELGHLVRTNAWVSDDVEVYPFPASLRCRYEQLDQFPERLVVTGDAIASFNPIYGQGMSVAALDAVQLHHALAAGGLDNISRRFFDRIETVVDAVWGIAAGADFEFDATTGPKPPGTDVFNRYTGRLLRQAHSDPTLSEAFLRVLRLEQSPTSLLAPGIAWRVLRPDVAGVFRSESSEPDRRPTAGDPHPE